MTERHINIDNVAAIVAFIMGRHIDVDLKRLKMAPPKQIYY